MNLSQLIRFDIALALGHHWHTVTTRRFKVLVEFDPVAKAWVTYVPALDNISTFGDTREEALEQTRELIVGYLEAAAKEGLAIRDNGPDPELVDLEVAIA